MNVRLDHIIIIITIQVKQLRGKGAHYLGIVRLEEQQLVDH